MTLKRCGTLITSLAAASALLLYAAILLGATQTDEAKQATIKSMYQEYKADAFKDISDIDAATVRTQLQNETAKDKDEPRDVHRMLLVDVREPNERAVSIITGAITQAQFEKNPAAYKERQVVIYCTIGYRSGVYVKKLAAKGVKATNLKGGILAWAHEGGPVQAGEKPAKGESKGAPTKRVHVYDRPWNLLPAKYEAIW